MHPLPSAAGAPRRAPRPLGSPRPRAAASGVGNEGLLNLNTREFQQLSGISRVKPRRFHMAVLVLAVAALLGGGAIAHAQSVTIDLGDGQSFSLRTVQLFLLITVLSLAPGLAIMVTCFPFMVTVLSILRQAIGVQQAPPNMMIVSLALFLTWFVMEPVFTQSLARRHRAHDLGRAPAGAGLRPGHRSLPQLHGRPRRSLDHRHAPRSRPPPVRRARRTAPSPSPSSSRPSCSPRSAAASRSASSSSCPSSSSIW